MMSFPGFLRHLGGNMNVNRTVIIEAQRVSEHHQQSE